jgi:hypothetical protein
MRRAILGGIKKDGCSGITHHNVANGEHEVAMENHEN